MNPFHCPECGGEELAIYAKCWVNWPEREVLPEDAEEVSILGYEEAICRECHHQFTLGEKYPSEK